MESTLELLDGRGGTPGVTAGNHSWEKHLSFRNGQEEDSSGTK